MEESQLGRLHGFMDTASCSARLYADMARRAGRTQAVRLNAMAEDERRHLRQLQTEHFLLAGDSAVPNVAPPMREGLLSLMRRAYLTERQNYDALMLAAQDAQSTTLAGVYIDIAADSARHASALREMIMGAI